MVDVAAAADDGTRSAAARTSVSASRRCMRNPPADRPARPDWLTRPPWARCGGSAGLLFAPTSAQVLPPGAERVPDDGFSSQARAERGSGGGERLERRVFDDRALVQPRGS